MDIKIIIVDDEAASIHRLNGLLKDNPQIKVISVENVPETALENITRLSPDLVFLDVEMPRISGFDLLKKIHEQGVFPEVVFVTAYDHYAIKAIKERAFDYLLKPVDLDELNACIMRISEHKNNVLLSIPSEIKNVLSSRELEILLLLKKGKSSKQIADKLFISKTTVDTHRRNILDKTDYKSTAELLGIIK